MSTIIVDLDENTFCRVQRGMLTPEQCRAARGWLAWSQEDLATKASVSLSTVRDFEKGRRRPIQNNLRSVEAALVQAGIAFNENGLTGPLAGEAEPGHQQQEGGSSPLQTAPSRRSRRAG
jgi:transcriptional regulator with XRE-family HTH domain